MSQNRTNNTVGKTIGKFNLEVGQWVKFSTEKAHDSLSEKQKPIYQTDRIFLVLTREDALFDSCRCALIDETGKNYDYCPRMHELNFVGLIWNHNIIAYSNDEVESFYEREKILSIYEAAQKYLDKMSDYFEEYAAKKLNVEIEIQQIKNKIIVNPYTQGATAGALIGKLPFELSTYVGTFLGRKEGGRLAQTSKLAAQLANEEKDKKMESLQRKI
jgi:hypothetical protein